MLKFIFWNDIAEVYSNVAAYKTLLTIIVAVTSAEGSFSNLKIKLKNQ